MGIVTRFVRLCKADIHGVMDQMEDKGLMLKQCLRDMEEELDRKDAHRASINNSLQDARRERERVGREADKLETDLGLALDKDKDDIARMLIRKIKPLKSHAQELDGHVHDLTGELAALAQELQEQKAEYERLKLQTTRHLHEAERKRFQNSRHGAALEHGRHVGLGGSLTDLLDQQLETDTDAEIELELLQRKEARQKAAAKGGKST